MNKTLLSLLLVIFCTTLLKAQTLTGKVTSGAEATGLPGVSVVVKGTTQGTLTDFDGSYTLEVPVNSTLVFSFLGYQTQEINYRGEKSLNVTLIEKATELNEIVVVGYSSISKKDITGSIASVKAEKFKDLSINGIDQALQGQVAGVQVTQSSGTPGGGISVRIRGVTSISAGNRPLFIVDGIPVETGALSGRSYGGQSDNALSLINPNDIESIEILKDASAKAVYGSRASNGVVVIKTKRGNNKAPKINFDVQGGLIQSVNKLDLLNSTQLLGLQREAVINAGQNPDAFGLISGVTDGVSTDWQDEVLRTGILQQYQLSVTGGDNDTKYYVSAGYRDEEGVQLNNEFTRMSLMINLDQKLSDKLNFGSNFTLSRALNKRVKGDNFLDGVYSGAVKSLPYFTPYDENGLLIGPSSPMYAGFPNFNPVAQALLPRFEVTTVKLLGNVNATYSFSKELTLKTQVSLDFNNVTEDSYESSQTAIGGFLSSVGGQGYGIYSASISSNVNSFITLSYSKALGNKHQLNAFIGSEIFQSFATGGSVQGRLFPSDDFTYVQSAGIVDNGTSLKSPPSGLVSFLGEASYNYDDRYLAKLTFRADGSSNFGPNHKFGLFPAVSAGWRVSQEEFFKSDVVSDLKVRASFGITGNERIGAFQYLATWGSSTYNGGSGVTPNNVDNPNIKWETTRELNVGVDVQLFNGRIQSSVDVYNNKTSDMLLVRPYPGTTGFGGIIDNIGDMSNKGIEFAVTTINVDNAVRWTTTVNLSKNVNKVLYLADSIPLYRGYTAEGVDGTNIIKVGYPMGTFWGLNYLGVDPATGDAIYQDRNKDGAINNSDAMVIGNSQAKLIGGITNTVSYKGFDLSVFFQFSLGNKVLNLSRQSFVNMGGDIQSNQTVEALRRWQKPGDVTDVPRYVLGSTLNNLHSNRILVDGSYLRLKNLSVGYNVPNKIINKLMLQQLRLYVTATNLLTFTKYTGADPEVSTLDGSVSAQGIDFFTLPQVKTIAFGINATLR
jgi:TonB-linked SusC/RagA family outer membrane protein